MLSGRAGRNCDIYSGGKLGRNICSGGRHCNHLNESHANYCRRKMFSRCGRFNTVWSGFTVWSNSSYRSFSTHLTPNSASIVGLRPIGVVRSGFKHRCQAPKQGVNADQEIISSLAISEIPNIHRSTLSQKSTTKSPTKSTTIHLHSWLSPDVVRGLEGFDRIWVVAYLDRNVDAYRLDGNSSEDNPDPKKSNKGNDVDANHKLKSTNNRSGSSEGNHIDAHHNTITSENPNAAEPSKCLNLGFLRKSLVRPPGHKKKQGLLATRSPHRPGGPIGLSCAKLCGVSVDGSVATCDGSVATCDQSRDQHNSGRSPDQQTKSCESNSTDCNTTENTSENKVENENKSQNTSRGIVLTVDELDLLDGTPVLDIKPYIPAYDAFENAKIAPWLHIGAVEKLRK
jgi:tRNA (Thr-GGU) A37 N-methylase